jgi:DNA repair exonuclease SbcCD ATPase subunit
MKITKLILSGYIRLGLNNIKYIEYTPESKIQLILGTNGSGKSSLMKELSPLPGIPNEFVKGGFKHIELDHKKSYYVLKSLFETGGNKFSFVKDDVELNPGHTVTVYKELVKKEFGITNDIHELMVGITRFHSMSSFERRTWMTRIADADYTFALRYYNRIKEQLRDIQGGLKLNQARLVQESGKLLKPEEEVFLRAEIKQMNEFLIHLLEKKTPVSYSELDLKQQLEKYDQDLKVLTDKLVQYRSQFINHEGYESVHEIEDEIIQHASSIQTFEDCIRNLFERIENLNKMLEALAKTNNESLQSLDKTLFDLNEESREVYRQIKHGIHFEEPQEAYNGLLSVFENLIDISDHLEANPQREVYNRLIFQSMQTDREQLSTKRIQLEKKQNEVQSRKKELEHYKEHNEVQCPQCSFKWYNGYNEREYQSVLQTNDFLLKEIEQTKLSLEKLDERIEKAKTYFAYLRSYNNITTSWPKLQPLWDYVANSELLFNQPDRFKHFVEDIKYDLVLQIRLKELNKQIKDSEALRVLVEKNESLDKDKIEKELNSLNQTMIETTRSVQARKRAYQRLITYRDMVSKIKETSIAITQIQSNKDTIFFNLENLLKRDCLNEVIQVVQLELSRKEQIISRIDTQKAIVSSLEAEIVKLTEQVEVLKIAVRELSPTEGLIAKGMTGFINQFIFQLNSFIKKVWSYDLELVAIEPDDNDLDYKFSVKVEGRIASGDISKTSSGMKEIIDLAFKIVIALKLDYPNLFLDEFGASFDAAHRQSAFYVITTLFTASNFNQIFMISHYENSYGSLKNTDITVLCGTNIPMSKELAVNRVAVIK